MTLPIGLLGVVPVCTYSFSVIVRGALSQCFPGVADELHGGSEATGALHPLPAFPGSARHVLDESVPNGAHTRWRQ